MTCARLLAVFCLFFATLAPGLVWAQSISPVDTSSEIEGPGEETGDSSRHAPEESGGKLHSFASLISIHALVEILEEDTPLLDLTIAPASDPNTWSIVGHGGPYHPLDDLGRSFLKRHTQVPTLMDSPTFCPDRAVPVD